MTTDTYITVSRYRFYLYDEDGTWYICRQKSPSCLLEAQTQQEVIDRAKLAIEFYKKGLEARTR